MLIIFEKYKNKVKIFCVTCQTRRNGLLLPSPARCILVLNQNSNQTRKKEPKLQPNLHLLPRPLYFPPLSQQPNINGAPERPPRIHFPVEAP
jgi:hypothetical protein